MIEKKHKFDIKGYFAPTPVLFRKIGDALLGSAQFITGYSIIMDEKWLAFTCVILGTVGKAMTNFFTESHEVVESTEQNL